MRALHVPAQPVLILGGFLITEEAYQPMCSWLQQHTQQPVELVPANRFDWLLTSWAFGWRRLLDRVAAQAEVLSARSATGKVTLIGHSSGGVMLRLFLADTPFAGRRYDGKRLADRLYTLGSPHTALRATPLRQMVDRLTLEPASPIRCTTSRWPVPCRPVMARPSVNAWPRAPTKPSLVAVI